MSIYAAYYAASNAIPGFVSNKPGRISHRLKLPFRWLIVPDFSFYGLHLGAAAEVFRWMVQTGDEYRARECQWGSSGPREMLSLGSGLNVSTCDSYQFAGDETFQESLRKRFMAAFFGQPRTTATVEWRRAHGLDDVYSSKILPVRWHNPMWSAAPLSSANTAKAVGRLFDVEDRKLRRQWNSCHPGAIWAHRTVLQCQPDGWRVFIFYGYKRDTSCWQLNVAQQEAKETFVQFIVRANAAMDRLFYSRAKQVQP